MVAVTGWGSDPKTYYHNPSHINHSCIGICIDCIGHISHAQSIMKPLIITRFPHFISWLGWKHPTICWFPNVQDAVQKHSKELNKEPTCGPTSDPSITFQGESSSSAAFNEEWNVEMTQLVLYSYLMDMGALHVWLIYLLESKTLIWKANIMFSTAEVAWTAKPSHVEVSNLHGLEAITFSTQRFAEVRWSRQNITIYSP